MAPNGAAEVAARIAATHSGYDAIGLRTDVTDAPACEQRSSPPLRGTAGSTCWPWPRGGTAVITAERPLAPEWDRGVAVEAKGPFLL